MNVLKIDIQGLKQEILKIKKDKPSSILKSEDFAFQVFVKVALSYAVETFAKRFMFYGVAPIEVGKYLNVGQSFIKIQEAELNSLDLDTVVNAVNLYNKIVKENPYQDILSLLAEEITLSRGRGAKKAQFMTPPEIAKIVSELLDQKKDGFYISDISVGYGSLILAQLRDAFIKDPKSLREIKVLVNDIDPFMCNVTTLQIMSNTIQHNTDLKELKVLCSDALLEYLKGSAKHIICYKTPDSVLADLDRIELLKKKKPDTVL